MRAFLLATLIAVAAAAPAAAAELKLDIRNGRVTLEARDVTIRQILTEWAKVGQTRIVNLERVSSGLVTLQLSGVPEREALDTILRSLSGYLAAPRAAGSSGTSTYDRILILATSAAPAARAQTPTSPGRPAGAGVQPRPIPGMGAPDLVLPDPGDENDDEDQPGGAAGRQVPQRPGSAPFGMPQPGLASQPGMVVQPPGAADQPDVPSSQPLQVPTGQPLTLPPWTPAPGTVTPGVLIPTPRPQGTQAPSGTRPPTPDR